MRIGFDAKRAFNNQTGLGNYSRFTIESLLKYAPEQEYLAYSTKRNVSTTDLFGGKNVDALDFTIHHSPFTIHHSIWRSWLIVNDLVRDEIDIYHGLSNEIPFGIRKLGVKSVVTIHDLIFLRYPELYPAIDRFIYNKKFRYACENADAIVAVSEQTKADIMEFYKIPSERIRVIYQDCQAIFRRESPLPIGAAAAAEGQGVGLKYALEKPYILCVSSFSERKNQKRLVEAFRQLGLSDYELILVGGKSKYAEEIAQNNPQNVRVLYGVQSADLPALYQGASLVVYPSFFEGFGIPIVEALHSGVPVVAATGSCLEEAGGGGALYANPLDSSDLANKMHQVLTNETLRNELILKGSEHIKQFSAERIAGQLMGLYGEL